MKELIKLLSPKDLYCEDYNFKLRELLEAGSSQKILSFVIDEGVIRGRHNLFRAIRKLTFVFTDYPSKFESHKEEIIVYHDIPINKTISFDRMPYVNQQTLNMLVGTYIGKCFITQIVDGKDDGNVHIYLSLPHN